MALNIILQQYSGARIKTDFCFFDGESKKTDLLLIINDFRRLKVCFFETTLKNTIRRLTINSIFDRQDRSLDTVCLRNIYCLTNLTHLEIRRLHANSNQSTFYHQTLQTLQIDKFVNNPELRAPPNSTKSDRNSECYKLQINAPNLTAFKTSVSLDCYEFGFPNSVRQLSLKYHENRAFQFTNLTTYFFKGRMLRTNSHRPNAPNDIESAISIPIRLNNLTILHVRNQINRNVAESFVRRSKLSFYYYGILIETIPQLNNLVTIGLTNRFDAPLINLRYPDNFQLVLTNYSRLAMFLPFTNAVHYNQLVQAVLPVDDDFFRRFLNIRNLSVVGMLDEEARLRLIKFISQCSNLNKLMILNSGLDQEAYQQLPVIFPNLKSLAFKEQSGRDLEFVLDFKDLRFFTTPQEVAPQFLSRVFTRFRFHTFNFTTGEGDVVNDFAVFSEENRFGFRSINVGLERDNFSTRAEFIQHLSTVQHLSFL